MIKNGFAFNQAAGAYAASQKLGGAGKSVPSPSSDSFADLLSKAVGGVSDAGKKAEAVSMKTASGAPTDLVDVVTAVAESEAALETLIAVRDKVIQAYEDIMRMPI